MIPDWRVQQLSDLFWSETCDDDSFSWRESLSDEELALVHSWDDGFDASMLRMLTNMLDDDV